jgi:hypothetical protein
MSKCTQGIGGKPEKVKPLGRRVDGMTILKWILKKRDLRPLTGLICHRIGTGCCEHNNEPLGSKEFGEFLY